MSDVGRDWKPLLVAIERDPRWSAERTKRNPHWKIRKDGRFVGTIPCSPSDRRGMMNMRARLRREGLQC